MPQLQYRLWGGNKLSTQLNKKGQGENNGESWEISAVPGFESEVASGKHKGKKLTELIAAFPKELLGEAVTERFGSAFPLLIKFIHEYLFPFSFIQMTNWQKSAITHLAKTRCGTF